MKSSRIKRIILSSIQEGIFLKFKGITWGAVMPVSHKVFINKEGLRKSFLNI